MKTALIIWLVIFLFVAGCGNNSDNAYVSPLEKPQPQQPNPAIGGGCGVAPQTDNSNPSSPIIIDYHL